MRFDGAFAAAGLAWTAAPAAAQSGDPNVNACVHKSGDESIAACTAAITSGKLSTANLAIIFYDRGVGYADRHDYARAIADYSEAIRLNPQYEHAFHNRGVAYANQDDHAHAIADYSEAIRLNPQDPDPFFGRGHVYNAEEDYARAIADYSEAIRLDPQPDPRAYNNRALAYHRAGSDASALPDAETAVKLAPSNADYVENRAEIYEKLGRSTEASADYRAALALQSGMESALKGLQRLGATPSTAGALPALPKGGLGGAALNAALREGALTIKAPPDQPVLLIDTSEVYGGQAVRAPNGRVLMQQGGHPCAYVMTFDSPRQSLSFSRAELIAGPSGVTHPIWSATAEDASGKVLSSVGEARIASYADVPASRFTLTGSSIDHVVFRGDDHGVDGFCNVVIADLEGAKLGPGQAQSAAQPDDAKVIKDPAEYHAYMNALAVSDPAAKAAAFEAFLSAYPASIMVPDALGQAMGAYQEGGNTAKVADSARRLLVLQPHDVRSLAILIYLARAAATDDDAPALTNMRSLVQRGLEALDSPSAFSGVTDTALKKVQAETTAIIFGARGFDLLKAKDYSGARDAYLKALESRPDNVSDNYQLGIAEVQGQPLNADGFWYLARAINLSRAQKNEVGAIAITTFAQREYQRFHGSIDGWDAIRVRAGVAGPIPADFGAGIKPGPTPAEIAVQAVRDNEPRSLSFGDWEYVLTYRDASAANAAAAEKVWAAIQTVEHGGAIMIAMPVTVVSATPAGIDASVTDEHAASHVADIHILLAHPPARLPKAGAQVTATGVITSYRLHPFRFVMTKARLGPTPPSAQSSGQSQ
jgi:tetratricopeptide (TPR) repeat protein